MIDPKGVGKLEMVCSKDELRPSLMGIRIDAEKKRLIATNGQILVIYPLKEDEFDEQMTQSATIPSRVLSEWRKGSKEGKKDYPIFIHGHVSKLESGISFDHIDEPYPNFESVIPRESKDLPVKFRIGLRADLLKQMIAGLKGEQLVFTFFGASKAVIVQPKDTDEFALIMPFRFWEGFDEP